jgi:hypothetical protein
MPVNPSSHTLLKNHAGFDYSDEPGMTAMQPLKYHCHLSFITVIMRALNTLSELSSEALDFFKNFNNISI